MADKVILITGGSSGIGAATALLFAKSGAKITLSYKENEVGATDIISKCPEGKIYKADLSNDDEAKKLVEDVIKDFGRIDILVNNAGRYIPGDEWNGEVDIWMKSIFQNLFSMLSVSKYTLKHFEKQQSGVMVNISSRYSKSGIPDAFTYSISKAGIVNATESYAKLMASYGRANAISPSAVRAGYWLIAPKGELEETVKEIAGKRLVEPAEVAELIYYLASDQASKHNGENILIDGAFDLENFKNS